MGAKSTVTAAMLYTVILVIVSRGYIGVFGETVRRLAGTSKTSTNNPIPTIGSGFDAGNSGGGRGSGGGGSW